MPSISIHNLRVALYARVSSEEQREGHTIESQIAELRRFADQQTWAVMSVYEDNGWSGALLARPALDHLRDDARNGLFDAVLINDVDRLARDVTHLGVIKRDLEGLGVRVIFRKLPSESSPTRNLMVNILGSFAEFEREMIMDRTRRGRRHKVEVRKEFVGALAAYGLRYVPKDSQGGAGGYLEIVPEEAAIARDMYRWVDREGLSARQVAARLTLRRSPTRKGGASWSRSTVLRILRSETYAGVWHYNKHQRHEPLLRSGGQKYMRCAKTSLRLRSREEWLPVVLPEGLRIIPRDRWDRVQHQLDRNRVFSPRRSKHGYLLKGLVKCGGCARKYVGDPSHGKFYYRCSARCRKLPTVREADLDGAVWTAVEAAVLNPTIIESQLEKVNQAREQEVRDGEIEAREVLTLLGQIDEEEARLLGAYRTGVLPTSLLGSELDKLTARRASLERRKQLLPPVMAEDDLVKLRRSVRFYCRAAARRLKAFGFADRQSFLRLLVKEILFEGEKIVIRGRIPIPHDRESNQRKGCEATDGGGAERDDKVCGIAPLAIDCYGRNPTSVQFELVRDIPRRSVGRGVRVGRAA
jgi:site-specific DNA recombinase